MVLSHLAKATFIQQTHCYPYVMFTVFPFRFRKLELHVPLMATWQFTALYCSGGQHSGKMWILFGISEFSLLGEGIQTLPSSFWHPFRRKETLLLMSLSGTCEPVPSECGSVRTKSAGLGVSCLRDQYTWLSVLLHSIPPVILTDHWPPVRKWTWPLVLAWWWNPVS